MDSTLNATHDTEGELLSPAVPATDAGAHQTRFLTTEQLNRLDATFADWMAKARGKRSLVSRNRCRLVFLLLRHTGAKLGEVLAINDQEDFDLAGRKVRLGGRGEEARPWREIYLPHDLHAELGQVLRDPDYEPFRGTLLALDQGYVRRVLYERAEDCGLPRHLANPNTLRRSRGIELLRGGVPLGAIQRSLGHLTANSTAAFLEIPDENSAALDMALLDRETAMEDSRNAFSGAIATITPGDVQSLLEVETLGGHRLVTVLSNDRLRAMDLRRGSLVTARIRPPRLTRESALPSGVPGPNRFKGMVARIMLGTDTAEVVVLLEDGARLCSVVTLESLAEMRLEVGETVWAMTGAFSITLSTS